MSEEIAARLQQVREHMADACARAGRDASQVTLIAVSKGHPADSIRAAHAAGQRDFGENYAQELRDKAQELADLSDVRWHFLGPVQTNKVKYLVPRIHLLHTLDRLELAEALDARLQKFGAQLPVLLEVNIGAEPQKHGMLPDDVPSVLEAVRRHGSLRVEGLMCIPPAADDPEEVRPHFAALRLLAQRVGLGTLSMGMSADYEVAIQEGATMVRVGTAIFGERPARGQGAG